MKATEIIGWLVGVFATLMATIYGFWTDWSEPVGTTGLYFGAALGYMLGGYLHVTLAKHRGDPSDNPLGEISDIQGDYGFFQPHSWAPLWLGLSAGIIFAGLAVGWWMFAIGAFFAIPALIIWTFEAFSGEHAQ